MLTNKNRWHIIALHLGQQNMRKQMQASRELHVPKTGRITYFISYPYKITLNSITADLLRAGIFIAKYLISRADIALSPKMKIIISNHSSLFPITLSSFCHNINPDELMYSIEMITILMLFLLLLSAH